MSETPRYVKLFFELKGNFLSQHVARNLTVDRFEFLAESFPDRFQLTIN